MKVTRIINSITQWLKVLQKFAVPRHTVAQDGTCGVDRWAWYVFGGRSRTGKGLGALPWLWQRSVFKQLRSWRTRGMIALAQRLTRSQPAAALSSRQISA